MNNEYRYILIIFIKIERIYPDNKNGQINSSRTASNLKLKRVRTNRAVLNSSIIGDLLKITGPAGARYQRADTRDLPENSTRVTATWRAGLRRQRYKFTLTSRRL